MTGDWRKSLSAVCWWFSQPSFWKDLRTTLFHQLRRKFPKRSQAATFSLSQSFQPHVFDFQKISHKWHKLCWRKTKSVVCETISAPRSGVAAQRRSACVRLGRICANKGIVPPLDLPFLDLNSTQRNSFNRSRSPHRWRYCQHSGTNKLNDFSLIESNYRIRSIQPISLYDQRWYFNSVLRIKSHLELPPSYTLLLIKKESDKRAKKNRKKDEGWSKPGILSADMF